MTDETKDLTVIPDELPNLPSFSDLLPIANVQLTLEQQAKANLHQLAMNVLGPAGGGCLVCPGNQISVPASEKCPYAEKCVLLKAMKAPAGELCPIEAQHITERFRGWCNEFGKTPGTIGEAERAAIAELVWIDTQEQRCASILARATDARLTQLNPKETHPETLEPISWERVIHANAERLDQLHVQRRMILRDWMLTPEMKAKKARWEHKDSDRDSVDISSKQSAKADRLRRMGTIEGTTTSSE